MNSDIFFNAAEKSLLDDALDIYVEKKLGSSEIYSIIGTPKALLHLSKQFYNCATDAAADDSRDRSLGPMRFEIRKTSTAVVMACRANRTRKHKRLGWSYLIVTPFWGLAAYGAYMLISNLVK